MKLSETSARRLDLPKGKAEAIVFDDDIPGFGLRLREGGSRAWVVQYKIGSKQRRMTLGSIKTVSATKARASAKDILASVRLGKDPQGEKAEARITAAETFKLAVDRFLDRQERRLRPKTYTDVRRYLLSHWRPLHGLSLAKITRATVAARLAAIAHESGLTAADRARAALSAMFAWAIREGLCDANPVIGTNKASDARPRERVLSDKELADVWRALGDDDYARVVKLLILTGSRREEIGGLRHVEVNLESCMLSLAGERTKNHRPHDIPLSAPACAVLNIYVPSNREFVFGPGKGFRNWWACKTALNAKLNGSMTPWRLHDLRRTVATGMAELGVQPHIVEAVLNHVSGHKAGIAGVYNRAVYAPEKAAALELWARHVLGLCDAVETPIA
jgi:integrase